MEMLIKGGTVINYNGRCKADVRVENGVITETGPELSGETAGKIIDARGLLVLPGAIDAHTHLEMKMGRTFSADSYETGTRAAACGGVTTVFDYTLQENGRSMLGEIEDRMKLAGPAACVDYAFHGGISEVNEKTLAEVSEMVRSGFTSIKAYMTYDFGLNDRDLYRLLKTSAAAGALITVHAESDAIVSVSRSEFIAAGKGDVWYHYLSRPETAEEEADIRAILLARAAGAPIYIVHLANAGGKAFIEKCKTDYGRLKSALPENEAADSLPGYDSNNINRYPVYAETCPHYLEFTNEVYRRPDGIRYICSPPMKGEASRKALWDGICDGTIDVIATDHCPAQTFEKDWGKEDFTQAPNGLMGIENMYPYMLDVAGRTAEDGAADAAGRAAGNEDGAYDGAASNGKMSFERAVELCSFNPARIFGCDTKGEIKHGMDADIVLYDPGKKFTISASNMHSSLDYTVYEGKELHGYPVMTISRGMIVYEDGVFKGEAGYGRLLRRGLSAAYRLGK